MTLNNLARTILTAAQETGKLEMLFRVRQAKLTRTLTENHYKK